MPTCRSAPDQDGEGATHGAVDGAADAGLDAAGEPLAPADDDGEAELEAAGVSMGAGDGLGFCVRKPP